jgi:hypothetical protein
MSQLKLGPIFSRISIVDLTAKTFDLQLQERPPQTRGIRAADGFTRPAQSISKRTGSSPRMIRCRKVIYCTAMVTVFDVTPPMEITTGTADSVADPAGTCAFTW